MSGDDTLTLHASSIEIGGQAALILGPSGAGKSTLALALISRGARLIADDMTRIAPGPGGRLIAQAPGTMRGVIEARGVGLLRVAHVAAAPLGLAVDLGETETERLPERRERLFLGQPVQLVLKVDAPQFPDAIYQLMKNGRYA